MSFFGLMFLRRSVTGTRFEDCDRKHLMTCNHILGNGLRENLTCFEGTDLLLCGVALPATHATTRPAGVKSGEMVSQKFCNWGSNHLVL